MAAQLLTPGLAVGRDEVLENDPAAEVGAGKVAERAVVVGQSAEILPQRLLPFGIDRGQHGQRIGPTGNIRIHRNSCTSVRKADQAAANSSGLAFLVFAWNSSSRVVNSSAPSTIVVVASGYADQKWLASISFWWMYFLNGPVGSGFGNP